MIEQTKKLTVSIGIPAYNEEANIGYLLQNLLLQKEEGFVLEEIIVISDGSSDKTVGIVKSIKDSRIVISEDNQRKGKAERQNEIVKKFSGDVLVMLDADTLPNNERFLKDIIDPLKSNEHVGLVGCENISLNPKTFFEKVLNFSVKLKSKIYKEWNSGNNIYMCSGAARAFSKEFAKNIEWKPLVGEDAYSYLECISQGYIFKFSRKAKIYVRSPDNYTDHIKQSARFMNSQKSLEKYFSKDLVVNSYSIPKNIILKNMFTFFIKNPILFTSYISVFLFIKLNPNKAKYSSNIWSQATSSKSLNNLNT